MARPHDYHLELNFAIRTRQEVGPVWTVNWSTLRSFQIRLTNTGNLAVSPIDFASGLATTDWLIANLPLLNDGQWHRVRFVLSATGDVDTGKYHS